jgi:predicted nucleic acid-binding protein
VNVLVVDTSVWIEYFKGKPYGDLDLALKEGRVHMAPLVAAELLSAASLKAAEREALQDFLKELPLCGQDFDHWARVGALRGSMASKGLGISTPDAHVAQCALDLEGYLLSEDGIFSKIAEKIPLKPL